jgi:hypothetical protein
MRQVKPGKVPIDRLEGTVDVSERLGRLARKRRFAALATLSAEGPHLSLVAFAIVPDLGELVFATPRNTGKFRNIVSDGRVSILLDGSGTGSKSVMGTEAISLDGRARVVRRGKRRDALAELLLAVHTELADFLAAPSTALIVVEVSRSVHVEDFQRVSVGHGP